MMQKIVPHLWFDKEAKEAAELYVSIFGNSRITKTLRIENTPSGTAEVVTAEIYGQEFMLLSGGPFFKVNPSVSFLIACETEDEVEKLWKELSPGGKPLMELGKYPFSDKYGWTEDRYGVSWQVIYVGGREITQKIVPTILFAGKVVGKAEDAMNFYVSVFGNSRVTHISRYQEGQEPDTPGTVAHAAFTLEGQEFAAMDSALPHDFAFNEATSFVVNCHTQEEIDYFWGKLSADPAAEQCGWLKDNYGLSWQIVPIVLNQMLADPDPQKVARVTQAFLPMKKLDIAALERAYEGT